MPSRDSKNKQDTKNAIDYVPTKIHELQQSINLQSVLSSRGKKVEKYNRGQFVKSIVQIRFLDIVE